MAELTKLGTESRTVRSGAIGLLPVGNVNVKPTAYKVRDGGISSIVRSSSVENLHVEPVHSYAGSSPG